MAGGKLTPRQKMINLMYLVFIAMLAMNMSKEVLSAFGLMNEKFEGANTSSDAMNAQMLTSLDTKAAEAKGEFLVASQTAHKVEAITKKFYDYIGTLKGTVLTGVEKDKETGKLPYEAMDKGDNIDNAWFTGEGYSPKGKEIVATIEKYKADMKAACSDKKYSNIISEITNKFDLADVSNKEGIKIKYLEYHFDKFPAVASLAKLSAWQSDVKKAESDIYSAALGKAAVAAASYSNYKAIVVLEKSAYFQGEAVKGKVVLGRYDENTKPDGVTGAILDKATGQAMINQTAGAVGEQKLGGKFTFTEDGKKIELPFDGTYVVVPRPNSATISADKMNVVYRGVPNPMSISFAGVGDNNVNASAPGMSKTGNGKYVLKAGTGTSVMINVSAKLPDGKVVSDKKEFRIKGLPAPTGKIRGEVAAKRQKGNLGSCTISAVMEDFDFPVTVNVTQFNIKVPGQPTIVVSGNKMDARARSAIDRATRGDVVVISEIKASFSGIDQVAKRVSTCTYEVQ
ncbi:gliding motility protein GldM [Flavobacterium sp.]|uniref:type IX secretion system motor protein PorM/GldM n=1 Tax=Flavobacterium sp. TaxID=239 RepID=UPI0038FC70C5